MRTRQGLLYSPELLESLLSSGRLSSFYQPIVSLRSKDIYGYESLCRVTGNQPFDSIEEFFFYVRHIGQAAQVDTHLVLHSISNFRSSCSPTGSKSLFLNINPSTILEKGTSFLDNIDLHNVVLEITEHELVTDMQSFTESLFPLREAGMRVAIDDFGAGYGGLKMLSILEPDFVKIDKHFFSQDNKRTFYKNLIDSIATICHRNGIEVIAEGIESLSDLEICRDFGIELVQGFFFARPEKNPLEVIAPETFTHSPPLARSPANNEVTTVAQITQWVMPLQVHDRTLKALETFQGSSTTLCFPVLDGQKIVGLLNRHRFMENHMVGRFGYGMSLNYYRTVQAIIETDVLIVPHYMPVEKVAKQIQIRSPLFRYDDLCVTRSGKYIGTVSVSEILRTVTDNSLKLAWGANPLTGFPGTEYVKRRVDSMISQSIPIEICSIDIVNFKGYNEEYGRVKGDKVISLLGEVIGRVVKRIEPTSLGFVGHLGNDDFVVVTRPKNSRLVCEEILQEFSQVFTELHRPQIFCSIVTNEGKKFSSFAEFRQEASGLKNATKKNKGSRVISNHQSPVQQNGCA
ncbi:MAG: EAL domain-containing protein [Spirochaetales bacterium]|nr:EAL domain-containing protein [Spirochaetales bacterium]